MARAQSILVLGAIAVAALFLVSGVVLAQENTITFPVAELGNCESKKACHTYCDDLSHVQECVSFAEAHNLMSKDEASHAREFARLGGEGPGGCTSKEACEDYCEDASHMRQCIQFARQSGVMDEQEIAEAEKVAAYLDSGGAMPGGCKGERECRAYCEDEAHIQECANFAIKAGFMSEKEAEMFKKTGGKGPGGCVGRQCQSFCEDETHREQCIAFALEHDLMSEEDKQRMEEGKEQAKQALEKAPPEVLSCIEAALGAEQIKKIRDGEGFISPRLGEVLPNCFREIMGDGSKGPFGPGTDATECMRKVFGEDFEKKMRSGELDPGAHDQEIRECMLSQMGEGFLNDEGRWESPERMGPPSGDGPMSPQEDHRFAPDEDRLMPEGYIQGMHGGMEEEYRQQFKGQYDARRGEVEERMRMEIESQMRSGNFDPSKLPSDFHPEGFFPPPESFNRPPEGGDHQFSPEMRLTPGMVMPDGTQPPQDSSMQIPQESPTSMTAPLLANVLWIFQSLLGVR